MPFGTYASLLSSQRGHQTECEGRNRWKTQQGSQISGPACGPGRVRSQGVGVGRSGNFSGRAGAPTGGGASAQGRGRSCTACPTASSRISVHLPGRDRGPRIGANERAITAFAPTRDNIRSAGERARRATQDHSPDEVPCKNIRTIEQACGRAGNGNGRPVIGQQGGRSYSSERRKPTEGQTTKGEHQCRT
jgi:hypothetical protein